MRPPTEKFRDQCMTQFQSFRLSFHGEPEQEATTIFDEAWRAYEEAVAVLPIDGRVKLMGCNAQGWHLLADYRR